MLIINKRACGALIFAVAKLLCDVSLLWCSGKNLLRAVRRRSRPTKAEGVFLGF